MRGDVRPGCFRADETYCEDRCRGDDAACGKSGLTKCHWVLLPRVDRCAKSVVRHAREVPQRRSRPEVTLDGSKKIWLLADGWLLDLLGRSAAFLIAFPPTASTRPTGHGLVRSDEDRQYIAMNFLPFEEASSTAMLQSFLKHVGRDKANGFSLYSWSAGLAFAEAATATVAKVGVNGLTRRSFLHVGVPTLTRFDAGGMLGKENIAGKLPTPCFVLVRLRDGRFIREHPMKKGTFDCKPSNRVQIKADLLGG